MKLEFLMRKLADLLSFKIIDSDDTLILKSGNMKIKLERNVLRIETPHGDVEISESEILGFEFFKRTNHCTITLKSGIIRICPENNQFKFFIRIK